VKNFVVYLLALSALSSACLHENYYLAEKDWSAHEFFGLTCLSTDPANDSMAFFRLADELKRRFPHVQITSALKAMEKDSVERTRPAAAPIVKITTPFFGEIGRFEGKVPEVVEFDPIFLSPAREDFGKALLKKKVVFLVVFDAEKKFRKPLLDCATEGKKMAKELLDIDCSIFSISLNAPGEAFLMNNLYLKRNRQPGIFVLFGKGKAIYFLDHLDPVTLLDPLQKLGGEMDVVSKEVGPRLLINIPKVY